MQEYTYIPYQELSDNALVERMLAGDDHVFEILFYRYQSPLYNFIGRCLGDYELAKDVLQHVFLQLYVSLPKLHLNLPTLRTKVPLKSWLFQVAWNRCIDEKRKKRPLLFCELESSDDEENGSLLSFIPDPELLPQDIAELHDLQYELRQAIQKLPPKFRSVVFLRYTQDLTFVEIGRILNMPENTAKTYFQRARPLLRVVLTDHAMHSEGGNGEYDTRGVNVEREGPGDRKGPGERGGPGDRKGSPLLYYVVSSHRV